MFTYCKIEIINCQLWPRNLPRGLSPPSSPPTHSTLKTFYLVLSLPPDSSSWQSRGHVWLSFYFNNQWVSDWLLSSSVAGSSLEAAWTLNLFVIFFFLLETILTSLTRKVKTVKYVEEYIGGTLCDLGLGKNRRYDARSPSNKRKG